MKLRVIIRPPPVLDLRSQVIHPILKIVLRMDLIHIIRLKKKSKNDLWVLKILYRLKMRKVHLSGDSPLSAEGLLRSNGSNRVISLKPS